MASKPSAWSMVTPLLLFSCFCLLAGDMLFGYDTGSFGGLIANPGFIKQFGKYNPETDAYAFDSLHTSLMSSLAFIGKFVGCFIAGPAIERYGHRFVFVALSIVSFVGAILEITAGGDSPGSGRFWQFVIGRIIVYISVGLVEVDVTTYQSEIVPASFRGLVVISLQLFLSAGTIVATGVNKAFAKDTSSVGWRTVTGIQFVFPTLIIIFTYFIPNSPRWLLSKDREEEAVESLHRLRPKTYADEGGCETEIRAIKEALQDQVHKAPWLDLIRGINFRRTMLVIVYYFFQQATGQAFVSTYQTVFYRENGYADQAFTYPVISSCLGFLVVIPAMYLIDKLGRRLNLMASYLFQAFWMMLLAGLGSKANKSSTEKNTVVAAFILFSLHYNMGGASIPYLLGTELPNAAVREKTQSLGAAWNVIWAFVTNYSIPYMLKDIHFKVGWVFGSVSAIALVFTFFFLPETKGLALEDIDAVFDQPFNPFRPPIVPNSTMEREINEHGDKEPAAKAYRVNEAGNSNV